MEVVERYEELRHSGTHTAAQAMAVACSSSDPVDAVAHGLIALAVMRRHVEEGKLRADDCERVAAEMVGRLRARLGEEASALLGMVPVVE